MDGLDEWKALPGERGNLADKGPGWLDFLDVSARPADEGPFEGKEKEVITPALRPPEPGEMAEALSPQRGSRFGGRAVETLNPEGLFISGVEAAWLARLPM